MRALAVSTASVLGGAAAFAALWWAFLNTPESTVFMLGLSILLIAGMYVAISLAWSGALLAWTETHPLGLPRRTLSGAAAFLLPALTAAVVWWAVGAALSWLQDHSGEISAGFIATFDWSDVSGLLSAATYLGEWLRRVAVPFAALVWFAKLLTRGWRPWFERGVIARALSPLRLLTATIVAAVTLWAPLRYGLYWVPSGLPATWIEPTFAAAKFAAMALIGAVGLSLIARLAVAREPGSDR